MSALPSRLLLAVPVLLAFAAPSLRAQALPPPPAPPQNPITPQKAVLGKMLFWEEQLSSNNRVACGTCHTFGAGGGDQRRARHPGPDGIMTTADDVFGSPGVPGIDAAEHYQPAPAFGFGEQVTGRSSPSALTGAYFGVNFWDGRAADAFVDPETGAVVIPTGGALESQAVGPILNAVEMSAQGRTWADVIAKLTSCRPMAVASFLPADVAAALQTAPTYPQLFANAFGSPGISAARIAMAIATYERILVPDRTPFDLGTMTFQQQMGRNMFGQFCAVCHAGSLFSDGQFHNLGRRPISFDIGRQAVTGNVADRGKFKTPSLRNAGLRTTFFHDGNVTTLAGVIAFYAGGGGPNLDNKDPLLAQATGIPGPAQTFLADFVGNALTDPRVAAGQPPFDRPTLQSQRLASEGLLYGTGTAGSGGLVPRMLAGVPANIGNSVFAIGLASAVGGAPAVLFVSATQAPPGSTFAGANVHVALPSLLTYAVIAGGANGVAGAGFATVVQPVPADPALVGTTLFAQWGTIDGGAAGGIASSRGAMIQVF